MARVGLFDNLKFKRLVKRLGLPRPYVRGLLDTMWESGWQRADPVIGEAEDVELAAEWPGESGQFFAAIKDDWLQEEELGVFSIHDFWDHAPNYVRKRYKRMLNDKDILSSSGYIMEDGSQCSPNGAERQTTADKAGPSPRPRPRPRPRPEPIPIPPPRPEPEEEDVISVTGSESSTPAQQAVDSLEELAGLNFTIDDVERIVTACIDKTPAQVTEACKRIAETYRAGNVRNLPRYAASVIVQQGPVRTERDAEEAQAIKRAQQLCKDLDLPWSQYNAQAMTAVTQHNGSVKTAVEATWADYAAKLFTSESPAVWWDRFAQHLESVYVQSRKETADGTAIQIPSL